MSFQYQESSSSNGGGAGGASQGFTSGGSNNNNEQIARDLMTLGGQSAGGASFSGSSGSAGGAGGFSQGSSQGGQSGSVSFQSGSAGGAEFGGASQGSSQGGNFGGQSGSVSFQSGSAGGAGFGGASQGSSQQQSFSASSGSAGGAGGAGFGGASGSSQQQSFSASSGGQVQVLSGGQATGLSDIEAAILRSTVPIDVNETEEITVNGQRGVWANKAEIVNWRGQIPITQYQINEDSNPEVITKRSSQVLEYIQELAIRYLRPPTPPAPGEIVITQETNSIAPPAPPLVIRQQPARPSTPEPMVIREAPPQPPKQVGRKVITISGKTIPPPPRKVVIERLAPLPSKPQSIFIERWLPYAQVKRRVIFQKAGERDAVVVRPKNVIVQWEAPQVRIKKEFKYLGVVRANPTEYVQKYGSSLKISRDLPQFVQDIKTPDGVVLAANSEASAMYELEGDVSALRLVDLDREGLSEYRSYLERFGGAGGASFSSSSQQGGASFSGSSSQQGGAQFGGASSGSASFGGASGSSQGGNFGGASGSSQGGNFGGASGASGSSFGGASSGSSSSGGANAMVAEIFGSLDRDGSGSISVAEAEKVFLRINSQMGRNYGESEVQAFFRVLDVNNDGQLSIQEFRAAFERL